MSSQRRNWWKWAAGAALAVGSVISLGQVETASAGDGGPTRWSEAFGGNLDWASPRQSNDQIAQVYSRRNENGVGFLHAFHDAVPAADKSVVPAVHYGHPFPQKNVRLADACNLTWKWRVLRHPSVGDDAWKDAAASVYVVTRQPSLLGGRGFKFGWLAKAGVAGKKQHGMLQVERRHDAASAEWRTERVDLCELYKNEFGDIDDEKVLYVGVMTDADGTKSVAEADYADFTLRGH